jgi:(p)ppGpp synthase/HD superfamily hydrolase
VLANMDAIEDQKISPGIIARQFCEDVAAIVLEVTDHKSLSKKRGRPPKLPPPATRAIRRS